MPNHIGRMTLIERCKAVERTPVGRTCLLALGVLLIVSAPIVGLLPGPGGIIVLAAGLTLALRNSEWAKRQYVRFKRKHPRKGAWTDWGMRRQSARRREALRKQRAALETFAGD